MLPSARCDTVPLQQQTPTNCLGLIWSPRSPSKLGFDSTPADVKHPHATEVDPELLLFPCKFRSLPFGTGSSLTVWCRSWSLRSPAKPGFDSSPVAFWIALELLGSILESLDRPRNNRYSSPSVAIDRSLTAKAKPELASIYRENFSGISPSIHRVHT